MYSGSMRQQRKLSRTAQCHAIAMRRARKKRAQAAAKSAFLPLFSQQRSSAAVGRKKNAFQNVMNHNAGKGTAGKVKAKAKEKAMRGRGKVCVVVKRFMRQR